MLRIPGHFLAVALLGAVVAAPTPSWAESKSKTEAMKGAEKSKAGGADEIEENRKAHMAKSKENNEKKGAE